MRIYIETLKRLLDNQKVTREKIKKMFEENKMTEEEYNYILKK